MGSSFNKFKIVDKETTIVYTQDVSQRPTTEVTGL